MFCIKCWRLLYNNLGSPVVADDKVDALMRHNHLGAATHHGAQEAANRQGCLAIGRTYHTTFDDKVWFGFALYNGSGCWCTIGPCNAHRLSVVELERGRCLANGNLFVANLETLGLSGVVYGQWLTVVGHHGGVGEHVHVRGAPVYGVEGVCGAVGLRSGRNGVLGTLTPNGSVGACVALIRPVEPIGHGTVGKLLVAKGTDALVYLVVGVAKEVASALERTLGVAAVGGHLGLLGIIPFCLNAMILTLFSVLFL